MNAMRVVGQMVILSGFVACGASVPAAETNDRVRSLAGTWEFRLDPTDQGVTERWYQQSFTDQITLPGSLQEQGFGDDVAVDTPWIGGIVDRSWFSDARYARYREPGNIKIPFWLQPRKHYVGPAWYQKVVTIPDQWRQRRVVLRLERCHWDVTVWSNGRQIGSGDSLSTAQEFELPADIPEQRLVLRMDNRLKVDVGINAHSVSDHTQSDWNGVTGAVELRAGERIWIEDVQVFPEPARKRARIELVIGNSTGVAATARMRTVAQTFNIAEPQSLPSRDVTLAVTAEPRTRQVLEYPLGDALQLWDEFRPALYRLTLELVAGNRSDAPGATRDVVFGVRELATRGTQFVLNGRPLFLRGTLECCIFPLTGYPPTDVEAWKRIVRICRQHGLNHIRFHSWCPPEAAFVAADELGFYYQVECAAWAEVGSGKPIDDWVIAEAERILRAYGNHPSLLLLAYGNEPAGPNQKQYLGRFVSRFKAQDPRRLYTSASGWPLISENQYHSTPQPRIHQWGAGLHSRINAAPPETTTDYREFVARYSVPVVSHEIGQWCVFPDLEEIAKYTGVLQARNFEVFRDFLEANHMGDQARDFLLASGKLQTICYKEEIESALRTPGFGGFQLLDLHDFPGQGTALVGVLDPFWNSKPYVKPAEFRRFCGDTVPLARLPQRTFTTRQNLEATLDVAHFGPTDIADATVEWRLLDSGGQVLTNGRFAGLHLATGVLQQVGQVSVPLSNVAAPGRLKLVVAIPAVAAENDWDVWVYPERVDLEPSGKVMVTEQLDDAPLQQLANGGRVLLLASPGRVRGGVVIGFSPVFWNTAWTGGQPPHTLGILCNPRHPVFAEFPTEYHSNWQWSDLIRHSAAMVLDGCPAELRPLVQPIDTWFESRRLGLLFEARVHGGALLVCSVDLQSDLEHREVARQFRHSLLRYMASEQFAPRHEVSVDAVRALFREPTLLERLGATASADSQQVGYEAVRAIDGDPATMWHSAWDPQPGPLPHELVLQFTEPVMIAGVRCQPRQDMANGRIARYAIYTARQQGQWGEPIAEGTWSNTAAAQVVRFSEPVLARFVRVVALSEVKGQPHTSLAEISLVLP